MVVCCGKKQLKWIQPLWNQSQGLQPHCCDTPSGRWLPILDPRTSLSPGPCTKAGLVQLAWTGAMDGRWVTKIHRTNERGNAAKAADGASTTTNSAILALHTQGFRWSSVSAESRWEEEIMLQFPLSKTALSMKVECMGCYKTEMQPPKLSDHLWLSSFW